MTVCWIVALLVSGAALELLGLGLVAWDVWDARRQRDALARQDQLVQLEPVIHSRALGELGVEDGIAGAEPPPLEERVATLEGHVANLHTRLDEEAERRVEATRALTDQFGARIAEVQRQMFDLEQRLRPQIGAVAAGKVRRRVLGVVLFAIGLMLQTIANVAAL